MAKKIEKKYGKYGEYHYIFTPTGIGCCVEVCSEIAKERLDLSDFDKW